MDKGFDKIELVQYAYGKYGEHVVALKVPGGNMQLFDACKIFQNNDTLVEYEWVKDEAARFAVQFVDQFHAGAQLPLLHKAIAQRAIQQERTAEFEAMLTLIPEGSPFHTAAKVVWDWQEKPEPNVAKAMQGEYGSTRQKEHNKAEIEAMDEHGLFILYDCYHSAYWWPDRGGYQYRKRAGLYTKENAAEVLLGSNRYFVVEERPALVGTAYLLLQ